MAHGTLILYLPDRDSASANTRVAWTLHLATGTRSAGATTLSAIPAAARSCAVVVLLPATRVTRLAVPLPNVSAHKLRELLPFAVEERVAVDPQALHVVVDTNRVGTAALAGAQLVSVVDRDWLSGWLTLVHANGFTLGSVVAETCLARQTAAAPALTLLAITNLAHSAHSAAHDSRNERIERWVWFNERGETVAIDGAEADPTALPAELLLSTQSARTSRRAPIIVVPTELSDSAFQNIAHACFGDLAVVRQAAVSAELGASHETNLFTPELAQRLTLPSPKSQAPAWQQWFASPTARRIAYAFSILLGLHALLVTAYGHWLKSDDQALRKEMSNVFVATFPGATVMDAPLQMQRQLEQLSRSAGQHIHNPSSFLAQLERARQLSAATGTLPTRLRYAQGVLVLEPVAQLPPSLAAPPNAPASAGKP